MWERFTGGQLSQSITTQPSDDSYMSEYVTLTCLWPYAAVIFNVKVYYYTTDLASMCLWIYISDHIYTILDSVYDGSYSFEVSWTQQFECASMSFYFLVFSVWVCRRLCGSWSARYHHNFVMCKQPADSVCLPWEKNRVDFVTCTVLIMRKVCKNSFCTLYACVYDGILVSFGGSSSSSWIIYESHALFNISMSPR